MACGGKKRKPNFADSEVRVLLTEIATERALLLSKFQSNVSLKKTTSAWDEICLRVNSCGVAVRTADDIRAKWKDLKRKVISGGKPAASKTGGGPPDPQGPYDDLILGIIGDDSATLSGIRGTSNVSVWLSVLGDEEVQS